MNIVERQPGDLAQLAQLARKTDKAIMRDRYRAVILAIQEHDAPTIVAMTGRSRRSVQDWCYAYRDHGIAGLQPRPRTGGQPPRLTPQQEQALRQRIDAGPTPQDGVCTLRGRDIRKIIENEFGKKYSLNGVYVLLHRLRYSCLAPRPRHEKQDPQAQQQFREKAPLLSSS